MHSEYKISVVCPIYTIRDQLGSRFLIEYLTMLTHQTFKNFNVVVSDQSDDNIFEDICKSFSDTLNIKHVRNAGAKGICNNINVGMRHATGEIIKILHVDDFFYSNGALGQIAHAFDHNPGKWLIGGFCTSDQDRSKVYNARLPRYDNAVVNGDNSTGNQSNYAIRREFAIEMDESLLFLCDGEFFYRSYYHYGMPIMINEILICFREHYASTYLSLLKQEPVNKLEVKERQYCVDKFNNPVEHKLVCYLN